MVRPHQGAVYRGTMPDIALALRLHLGHATAKRDTLMLVRKNTVYARSGHADTEKVRHEMQLGFAQCHSCQGPL